jgi:hypothetical protein
MYWDWHIDAVYMPTLATTLTEVDASIRAAVDTDTIGLLNNVWTGNECSYDICCALTEYL